MLKLSKHSGMVNPNHALSTVSQNSSGKNKNTSLQTCTFCTAPGFGSCSQSNHCSFSVFRYTWISIRQKVRSKKLHSKEQNHSHHKQALNSDKWNSVYHRIVKFTICPFQGCAETVQNRYWGWSPLQVSGLAARWMKITVQLIAWCTE